MRFVILLSAIVSAVASFGATIVDLTAMARKAGTANYAITASSEATSSSSAKANRPAKGAFDGDYSANSANAWWTNPDDASGVANQWIAYQFKDTFASGKYIHLTDYAICANAGWMGNKASTCRGPRDWTFEGSNDGETWVVLDTQSGHQLATWNKHGPVVFPLAVNACYRYYRLKMTAIVASSLTYYIIPDIQLHGEILDSETEAANTRYWVGGAAGDWNDAANWTQTGGAASVPQAGDRVFLGGASAVSVTLSQSTPRLADFRLGGYSATTTLTTTNWLTAVNADVVEIGNAGVLTCAKSTTVGGETNRVYVTCGDFTVAKGGSVLADACGYIAENGPGCGDGYVGAAHGGFGGIAIGSASAKDPTLPYGDEEAPTELGSGGTSTKYDKGATGGGAIRLVATGNVSVYGTISANGGNAPGRNGSASSAGRATAGSGGSVYITCQRFAGTNGIVRADGGGGRLIRTDDGAYNPDNMEAAAGGGRLAIHAVESSVGHLSGMTFSAAAGCYKGGAYTDATKFYSKVTNVDRYRTDADLGTLWFSDTGFLESLGTGITGQIRGVTDLTLDSLTMTTGHVRFSEDGCTVNVTGDVIVSNDTARLEIGGDRAEVQFQRASLRGDEAITLKVGGNLRVEEGGRLDVYAAATNGVVAWGAEVKVMGDLYVGTNASVRAWSDPVNGGSATFSVSNATVAVGGLLTASELGFAAGWDWANVSVKRSGGEGPGGPKNDTYASAYNASGAAHGGVGGFVHSSLSRPVYGDEWNPTLAGSGGCCRWKYQAYGGFGGGVVHVTALDLITVDGTVSADGMSPKGGEGAGSGGSVFLYGQRLAGEGRISATGGSTASTSAGTGGGGRVAIWLGLTGTDLIHRTKGLARDVFTAEQYAFAGDVDVAAGTNTAEGASATALGAAGTVRYVRCDPKSGLMLIIR